MIRLTTLAVSLLLSGCAAQPSYRDQVLGRPAPSSETERRAECEDLRVEVARQQSLAAYGATMGAPMMAAAYQAAARQNIAIVEARAANIGCRAAFQSVAPSTRLSFDQCMEKCSEFTKKTREECFDTCNK
jgi:hypothetical protein